MAVRLFLGPALLTLAACSPPEETAQETGGADAAEATASAGEVAAGPRELSEETELYLFEQSWPEAVGALPALAAKLDREGAAVKRELATRAEEDRQAAQDEGFPYNKHSYGEEWKVLADLPGWLSLWKEFHTFMGGAHGIYGKDSLLWNKQTGEGMAGIELFASPAVLEAALGPKLCDALDAERLRRRGPEYLPDPDDPFSDCPGIDEATVLVGSSNGRTFDEVGIYFGPYVAGPYAEGAFELEFPVDAEVLDAVKPEYRSAFSIRR